MIAKISELGVFYISLLTCLGRSLCFFSRVVFIKNKIRPFLKEVIKEIYKLGFLSLLIILLSSLFIGMVLALQGYNTLVKFGSDSHLGPLVALSVVRELSPVITCLLFAGRSGSSLTAEIGLMKSTEQLTTMEIMGVEPMSRVVAPRFWAGIVSVPILSVIFSVVAIFGGYLVGVQFLGIDSGIFWNNIQSSMGFWSDIFCGIVKSFVFSVFILWIAVYQGYYCKPTSEGIAMATTKTVVISSIMILFMDLFLTVIMMGGW